MFSYITMLKSLKYFIENNFKRTASIAKTGLPRIAQFLKTTSHNMDGPDFGNMTAISSMTADISTKEELIAAMVIFDFLNWLSEKSNGGTMGRAGMLKHIADAERILEKINFVSPNGAQSKDIIVSKIEALEDIIENFVKDDGYKNEFLNTLEEIHSYIEKH